ncbi:MAG: hypothetical protein ACK4ME_07100 [Fimbriimonadales bacterium]
MRQTILRWSWRLIKPILLRWLRERALRLPEQQRDALARRLGAPVQTVEQIEMTLRQLTLYQLERWNP